MKHSAQDWADSFKEAITDILEIARPKIVCLENWVLDEGAWHNEEGMVTLFGDAEHLVSVVRLPCLVVPLHFYSKSHYKRQRRRGQITVSKMPQVYLKLSFRLLHLPNSSGYSDAVDCDWRV